MISVIVLGYLCYMYHAKLDWPMQMVRVMTLRYEFSYVIYFMFECSIMSSSLFI